MKYLVFDTETEAWAPAALATTVPEFVAAGFSRYSGPGDVFSGLTTDKSVAYHAVRAALEAGTAVVGHNLAFDFRVLGIVPEPGQRVWDTMFADMLERLARDDCGEDAGGSPVPRSLADLSGQEMEGKGTTQLSFKAGHPLTSEQERYLREDVATTERVFLEQERRGLGWALDEMMLQVRARMALDELTRTGLPVDDAAIREQEVEYSALRRESAGELRAAGMWEDSSVGPRGGKRKAKTLTKPFLAHVQKIMEDMGEEAPLTEKGKVKVDKDALSQLTHDPVVKSWQTYKSCEKLLSTYLQVWKGAGTVHARYRSMVRSGRTSCHSPNLQQVPSRGDKAQLKKVFVAPPGRVLYELDYCQLELCCLAAVTRGELFRRINLGEDLHRYLGSVYFGKPAAEVTKDERYLMKCANFGLPGGMGPKKFRTHIRKAGLPDPGIEKATALRNAWLAAYPEMTQWLEDPDGERISRYVRQLWAGKENVPLSDDDRDAAWALAEQKVYTDGSRIPTSVRRRLLSWIAKGQGQPLLETWLVGRKVTIPGGRTRHPVSYTEQHNTRFQGLAANLTKDALASVVFNNGRTEDGRDTWSVHAFVHDSVLISVGEHLPQRGNIVHVVTSYMLDAARRWLPDVRCGVEVTGPGKNWYETKKAEAWSVYTS